MLPMCLSNFKAIQQFKVPISWLWDFTRSYEKTSFRILRRGPGALQFLANDSEDAGPDTALTILQMTLYTQYIVTTEMITNRLIQILNKYHNITTWQNSLGYNLCWIIMAISDKEKNDGLVKSPLVTKKMWVKHAHTGRWFQDIKRRQGSMLFLS